MLGTAYEEHVSAANDHHGKIVFEGQLMKPWLTNILMEAEV